MSPPGPQVDQLTAPLDIKSLGDHSGGQPRVVLVHGSMDRGAGMLRLARALTGVEVITYDRRGYGRSPRPDPGVDLSHHAGDLIEILDGEPALLVGHSMGGVVALRVACDVPELVRGVLSYEAPMPWAPWWESGVAGNAALDAAIAGGPSAAVDVFLSFVLGPERWASLDERARDLRRQEGPALIGELSSVRAGAVYDANALVVPVMAVHGSAGAWRHRRGAEELARCAPQGSLRVIDGAAHPAPMTHPVELAALVKELTSSVTESEADSTRVPR